LASLLAVAFVPASALAYLQYRALSEVQQQTRLTMTANLQQALIGARVEAAANFWHWPDRALNGYEIHDYLRNGQKDKIRDAAETARRVCPFISYFFSYRSRPGSEPDILILRPERALWKMEYSDEKAVRSEIHKLITGLHVTSSHTYPAYIDLGGERQQVFLHLVDDDGDEPQLPHIREVGYVGFAAPAKVLASEYFVPLLKMHLARLASTGSQTVNDQAQGAIFDGDNSEIGTSKRRPSGSSTAQSFTVKEEISNRRGILPGWTMRARLSTDAIASFDQAHFERAVSLVLMITAFLAATLVSIGMTTNRQIELSRTKTEFVASMSHELRTPLSIIRGFVETLRLNRLLDAIHRDEYFGIIETEILRLSNMIDRILEISKIEAGLKRYEPEPVDVAKLIDETLTNFSHELDKRSFVVECQIEVPLPGARVDPLAFSQALLNLLSNAVKYSDSERRITVRAARSHNRLEISVSDCGMGIPRKDQPHIFDRFYRASQSAAKTAGAGLGLALVKHFADAHGGEVTVTSTPGKGSVFAIFLPLVQ
jgi:two-component system, OmpR family, phosphate regulon sensor histidine kinase PhoR